MVEDLIHRARRRFILNETLAQLVFAAGVVAGGFSLLLIVGTRYMAAWSIALLAVSGAGVGLFRILRRTPGRYATALAVDRHARLNDTLSTALYFSGPHLQSSEFQRSQREQAEAVAQGVNLEQAVPFVLPKSLYTMAALWVLASCLVALRFGLGHGLDLRPPLSTFLLEDQAIHEAKKQPVPRGSKSSQWMDEAQSLLSKMNKQENPNAQAPGDPDALDKAIQQAIQGSAPEPKDQNADGKRSDQGSDKGGGAKEGAPQGDQKPGDPVANDDKADSEQGGGADAQNSKGAGASKPGSNSSPGSKESLLSRLKDAVSNIFSKSDENGSSAQNAQQSAKNDSPEGSKSNNGKSDSQQGKQSDGQQGQPDSSSQSGQQAQTKVSSSGEKQPGQGGSGIGSQDGSKELREAAQLKAMGKISEIIGQRAATVTGETTVEVQSGNQKLQTDYSSTQAAHHEADGDVTRDEIPVALQPYVQQYFSRVRKSGAR